MIGGPAAADSFAHAGRDMTDTVKIIGAGLAGPEAAWQCARRGIAVELFEMRPARQTPAHETGDFAELVCSNSLKSDSENSAPWLLKEEMRRAGSLLMETRTPNRRSRRARTGGRPAGFCARGDRGHRARAARSPFIARKSPPSTKIRRSPSSPRGR